MKKDIYILMVSLLSLAITGCGGSDDKTPPESTDTSDPVISLIGDSSLTLTVGDNFTDPGTTVVDNIDTGLVAIVSGSVDTTTADTYTLTYTVSDTAGNEATVTRTVVVVVSADEEAPVITLLGDATMNLILGDTYTEPGSSVTDNVDTGLVAGISGVADTSTVGVYTVTYTAIDAAGNEATVDRTVVVAGAPVDGDAYIFHSTNDDSFFFEYWGDVWGTNTQYSDQPTDTTYAKALEISKSEDWGSVVAWGNEVENAVSISNYTHAKFKVKSDTFTGVQVFVQSATVVESNITYNFSSGIDLQNGWVEMEVTLPGFTDMTWFAMNFIGESGTVHLSDLYFTTRTVDVVGPAEAAPVPPFYADDDVIVLYSDSLTMDSFIGVWNANWWNAPVYAEGEVAGNHYAKYTITDGGVAGGVTGLEFGFENGALDASSTTLWNFDMFVESGITEIKLQLVSADGGATYSITNPATDVWVTWDLLYSEISNNVGGVLNPANLESIGVQLYGASGQSVYLDNIYFSGQSIAFDLDVTVTDDFSNPISGATVSVGNVSATTNASGVATLNLPEGDQKVVVDANGYGIAQDFQTLLGSDAALVISVKALNAGPSIAAPVPTVSDDDAFVLYSDSLIVDKPISFWSDNWWNAPMFAEEVISGNNTAKLQIIPAGVAGGVTGIQYGIQDGVLNASTAKGIRFDMFATSGITQAVFQVVPATGKAGVYTMATPVTGQWVTVEIPFVDMTNGAALDTVNLTQYGVQLWGTTSDALYLDNILFYK